MIGVDSATLWSVVVVETAGCDGFPRCYNAAGFATNRYDEKLAAAHTSLSNKGLPDLEARAVQLLLTYHGFNPKIDGVVGGLPEQQSQNPHYQPKQNLDQCLAHESLGRTAHPLSLPVTQGTFSDWHTYRVRMKPPRLGASKSRRTGRGGMPSSAVYTFTDPDDWTTTFRGSRAQLTITARGQFAAKLTWIGLHRLQMQRFFDNLPRILHTAHLRRRATISFLAPQGPPQRWGTIDMDPADIMFHNLDQEHFQQASGFASSHFMSLPVEDLGSVGETMIGCELTPPKDALLFRPEPYAITKLRRLHAAAGRLAEEAPEVLANPDAARGLEQALIEAMVGCLGAGSVHEDSVAQRQHELIMRRFHRVLEEKPGQSLYVTEVCKLIRVSERTLEVCCQEQLGGRAKTLLGAAPLASGAAGIARGGA